MSAATRLTDILARATGATIDPIMACPHVEADGALTFCADPSEAAIVVAAMQLHGVAGCTARVDVSDPEDVYAIVKIPIASLERGLAKIRAEVAS